MLKQNWSDSAWVNEWIKTYTFDMNDNLIEELGQDWSGFNWVNDYKFTLTYIIAEIKQLTYGIKAYFLSQNYPNPFNPATVIKYQIPEAGFVTLKVFDVLGNEIATLVNEERPVGTYEVSFDATDLPSGIYSYRLQAGDYIETKKMVLVK